MTTTTVATTTTPIRAGKSLRGRGGLAGLAQTGQREEVLDDHRAAEQGDELDAEHGHDRHAGEPQRVHVADPPLRCPHGPQRADVLLAAGPRACRRSRSGR